MLELVQVLPQQEMEDQVLLARPQEAEPERQLQRTLLRTSEWELLLLEQLVYSRHSLLSELTLKLNYSVLDPEEGKWKWDSGSKVK